MQTNSFVKESAQKKEMFLNCQECQLTTMDREFWFKIMENKVVQINAPHNR